MSSVKKKVVRLELEVVLGLAVGSAMRKAKKNGLLRESEKGPLMDDLSELTTEGKRAREKVD